MVLRELVTRLGFQFNDAEYKKAEAGFKKLQNAGEKLSGIGKQMSLFVTTPLLAFAGAAVMAADKADSEAEKLVDRFKEAGDEALKASDKIVEAYGFSNSEARKFVATTGGILKALDLSDKKALDYSKTIIDLGVNLASYNGIDNAQAIDALTSALAGRVQGLRQLGIIIDQTEVAERVLTMTQNGARFTSDRQAESMAILALMTEKASFAADSYNLRMKGLGETKNRIIGRLTNLAERFGKLLLPTIEKILLAFERFIERLSKADDRLLKIIAVIGVLVAAIGPLLIIGGTLITMFSTVSIAAAAAGVSLGAFLAPILLIIGKGLLLAAAIALVVIAIEDFFSFLQGGESYFGDLVKWLSNSADAFTKWINEAIKPAVAWIDNLASKVRSFFGGVGKIMGSGASAVSDFFKPMSSFGNTVTPSAVSSGGGSSSQQTNNIDVKVDARGMNPDQAAQAVQRGVQSATSNVYRAAIQNLQPAGVN